MGLLQFTLPQLVSGEQSWEGLTSSGGISLTALFGPEQPVNPCCVED